jgi:hypothetical protein
MEVQTREAARIRVGVGKMANLRGRYKTYINVKGPRSDSATQKDGLEEGKTAGRRAQSRR